MHSPFASVKTSKEAENNQQKNMYFQPFKETGKTEMTNTSCFATMNNTTKNKVTSYPSAFAPPLYNNNTPLFNKNKDDPYPLSLFASSLPSNDIHPWDSNFFKILNPDNKIKSSIQNNYDYFGEGKKNENESCCPMQSAKDENKGLSLKEIKGINLSPFSFGNSSPFLVCHPTDNRENIISMSNIIKNQGLSQEEIKVKEMCIRTNDNNNKCVNSNNELISEKPKKSIFEEKSKDEVLIIEQQKKTRQVINICNQRRLSEDTNSLHTKYDYLMKNGNTKPNVNDYMTVDILIKEPSKLHFVVRIKKDSSFFDFKQSICEILKLRDSRYENLTPNMFCLKKQYYIVKEAFKLKQSSIKNNDALIIILKENAVIGN